jgi:peptidyl-prolyl isomerase D
VSRLPFRQKHVHNTKDHRTGISGKSLVRAIEALPTSNDKPNVPVIISECGVLSPDEPIVASNSVEGDIWEDWPQDEEKVSEEKPEESREVAGKLKELATRCV